ncbi:related to secreted protein-Streptomyces sviceus [Serendipita indica DSM 11827]|uniref:Related to secreted protein-Streptomyces sviceus n=1 Tax=Serendipita indica (strain DSM 11827) TaxID=1109443 RepID=G4TSM0_SERID|nr:related to secreted protein-Streptomyces sviceus [Serendipita indica DSM 11827]
MFISLALLAHLFTFISVALSPSPVAAAPSRYVHPGVFLSRLQLDFIRLKVILKLEPWKTAYDAMLATPMAFLNRTATPWQVVECGSNSNPNKGCTPERQDALAAYAMSLAWYIERKEVYAQKALEYMNAWSYVLQGHNNTNAPLQTGWSGANWARAAEIMRHTYPGWQAADIAQFETMLRTAYVPQLLVGSNSNGNWELVMMEAAIGIAVFLEDSSVYDAAMAKFLGRVPAYIYLSSDGDLPKIAPSQNATLNTPAKLIKYWQYQDTFVDGLTQETCRDYAHAGYGLASIGHVMETARIQGDNMYSDGWGRLKDFGTRLFKALEFHAQYEPTGGNLTVPSWLCNGTISRGLGPITEVGLNALHARLRYPLPYTEKYTVAQRPAGTNYLFVAWETLTHGGCESGWGWW